MAGVQKGVRTSFIRSVLSYVLSSGASPKEMRDLADSLRSDLSYELSDMIYELSERLQYMERRYPEKLLVDDVELVAEQIQSSGMDKLDVFEIMRMISGPSVPKALAKYGIDRMLIEFKERVSDAEWREFEKTIKSARSEDPFLRGISKRS